MKRPSGQVQRDPIHVGEETVLPRIYYDRLTPGGYGLAGIL